MTLRDPPVAAVVLWAAAWSASAPLAAQSSRAVPSDAFVDDGARVLVTEAFGRRRDAGDGLLSYEAPFTERMRVGVGIGGGIPVRDRTLYHREQVGRARWSADGEHTVRWLGRRKGSPTFGDRWLAGDEPFDIDFDPERDLDLDDLGAIDFFDPNGERLDLFDAEFIQPVSTLGLTVYRFESGDTLRLQVARPNRSVELVEVRVVPRYDSWETVEGSLWFDRESGVLVRAAYRPSAPWDMAEQEPDDVDDIPFFLRPARGTVDHIVIEYALYEQRWWLPRRVLAEGVFHWGDDLMRMPLQIEWTMGPYTVNEAPGAELDPATADLRRVGSNTTDVGHIEFYAERGVDLADTPDLPEPLRPDADLNFDGDELAPLLRKIEDVGGQLPPPTGVGIGRELIESVRYDRVRGPSVGYRADAALGRWATAEVGARVGAVALQPSVDATVRRDRWSVSAYSGVRDVADFGGGDGVGNTLGALFFGHDDGEYVRASGGALGFDVAGRGSALSLRAFAERHDALAQATGFWIGSPGGGGLRPNVTADEIDVAGLGWEAWRQVGDDPQRGVLHLRTWGEAARGDREYVRGGAGVRAAFPVSALAFALDVSAGAASDDAPVQRGFFLGGTRSLRGFAGGAMTGASFWMARAEGAAGLPGLRWIGFTDVGWAGAGDRFFADGPAVDVGAGISLMDGLLRIDLARGVRRGGTWRLALYADGLF